MNWLKRLWTEEPVIVRVGLAAAVDAGLLTAAQAAAWADVAAALVVAVAGLSARGKVTPDAKG